VLGAENVRMIFSSVWAERERGLRNVHSLIVAGSFGGGDGGGGGGGGGVGGARVSFGGGGVVGGGGGREQYQGAVAAWRCICDVLHTMAKDKVAPVYFAALEALSAAAAALARKAGAVSVHDGLDEVIPTLVSRAGNLNGRISASSIEAVVSLLGLLRYTCNPVVHGP
jgi:hypothetical protein